MPSHPLLSLPSLPLFPPLKPTAPSCAFCFHASAAEKTKEWKEGGKIRDDSADLSEGGQGLVGLRVGRRLHRRRLLHVRVLQVPACPRPRGQLRALGGVEVTEVGWRK
eukprot:1935517-Rhodomonas_salina.1